MHGTKVSRRGVASKEASTQRKVAHRQLKVVNRQLIVDKSKRKVVKLQKFSSTICRIHQCFAINGCQCTVFGTLEHIKKQAELLNQIVLGNFLWKSNAENSLPLEVIPL